MLSAGVPCSPQILTDEALLGQSEDDSKLMNGLFGEYFLHEDEVKNSPGERNWEFILR